MSRAAAALLASVGVGLVGHAAPAVATIAPLRRAMMPTLAGRLHAPGASEHIALTYDDGPDPASTPAFLDLLASHQTKATFFVLGAQAEACPGLVRRMVAEGHEVALHGWSHRCTLRLAPGVLSRELRRAKEVVEDLTGSAPQWYRPPYGVGSLESTVAARRLGMQTVLWTAWGRDWEKSATPDRVERTVLSTLRGGGTILLHDTNLHARGDWRDALVASERLLSGWLVGRQVGPLREHR